MKYLIFILALSLTGCSRKENCSALSHVIVEVGGCDSSGDCGALLSDGVIVEYARQPVVGARPKGPRCKVVKQWEKQ